MQPVALITGCAGGIGAALAHALIAKQYRLVLTDIDEAGLHRQFGEQEHTHILLAPQDIRVEEDWRRVFDLALKRWQRLDYLFNVAGYLKPGYAHECAIEDIEAHLRIDAEGPILGTRLAAEIMVRQGSGHIINIASLAGVAPVPGLSLYAAAKFAVRGYSLAAAEELRPHGVAVTVICPDAVQTPMLDLQVDYPQAALTFSGSRVLTTDDVVHAIMHKALPRKPQEILLPLSRGIQAKIASFFPRLIGIMGKQLAKRGRCRQQQRANADPKQKP